MNTGGGSLKVFSFIDWVASSDDFEDARFEAAQSFMLIAMVSHCSTLGLQSTIFAWYATRVFLPILVTSCLVGFVVRSAKPYCVMVTFGVTSIWLAMAFPHFANHLFLEWSILLFLTLCQGDRKLGLNGLRWLVVIVLFHSGFQKLVMGQYFEAQLVCALISVSANFRDFFGIVMSDSELARLVAMGGVSGTGPYASHNPAILVLSNGIWIAEMGIGLLLLVPRFRSVAMWAGLALILGIELGAREVVFGCLFVFLVLMFNEGKKAIALWPVLAGIQFLAMLSRYVLPGLRLN